MALNLPDPDPDDPAGNISSLSNIAATNSLGELEQIVRQREALGAECLFLTKSSDDPTLNVIRLIVRRVAIPVMTLRQVPQNLSSSEVGALLDRITGQGLEVVFYSDVLVTEGGQTGEISIFACRTTSAGTVSPDGGTVIEGKMSDFGGPKDTGVRANEGLALVEPSEMSLFPNDFFETAAQTGAPGLARRINPQKFYIAYRWPQLSILRAPLQRAIVGLVNPSNGATQTARIVDWGPAKRTGRIADLSPGLASALGLRTDDVVRVTVPKLL
jgi:hypothetical protein